MEERKPTMDLSALGGLKKVAKPAKSLNEEPLETTPLDTPAVSHEMAEEIPTDKVDIASDNPAASEAEGSQVDASSSESKRTAPAPIDDVDPAMEASAPLTFSLPEDLIRKVRNFNKDKKISYPNIVLNAIDATYDKLPSLLEPEHFQVPTRNLFQRPSVIPTTTARDGSTRKETMTMRMKKKYIAVLDQIAAELTDKNRTKLVETALKEYLKKEK